jgi:hypothetical protein
LRSVKMLKIFVSKVALSASSSQLAALLLFAFNNDALVDNVGQIVSKLVLVLVGLLAAAQIVAKI